MTEIVVLTCEFEGEGINIKGKLKRNGKEIIKFNASSKYLETLEKELDKMIFDDIKWKEYLERVGCHSVEYAIDEQGVQK